MKAIMHDIILTQYLMSTNLQQDDRLALEELIGDRVLQGRWFEAMQAVSTLGDMSLLEARYFVILFAHLHVTRKAMKHLRAANPMSALRTYVTGLRTDIDQAKAHLAVMERDGNMSVDVDLLTIHLGTWQKCL